MWAVVGAPQALHFEQLNALARRLGIAVPITHIQFGSILGADGKIMRTRAGDNVSLRELLDEPNNAPPTSSPSAIPTSRPTSALPSRASSASAR